MLPYDLSEQATLFECDDPLDDELSGQPVMSGSLRETIEVAMTWADCRLSGARIATLNGVEYRQPAIGEIYNQRLLDRR